MSSTTMQFSLRQLMLTVAGLSAWFGAMAQGYYLFGSDGVLLFGSLFGLSIFYLLRTVLAWSRWTPRTRAAGLFVVLLSSLGGIYLTHVWLRHGFDVGPEMARNLPRLQAALRADPKYDSVVVSVEHFKNDFLRVRGSVADQETLESLQRVVESDGQWVAVWQVEVDQE